LQEIWIERLGSSMTTCEQVTLDQLHAISNFSIDGSSLKAGDLNDLANLKTLTLRHVYFGNLRFADVFHDIKNLQEIDIEGDASYFLKGNALTLESLKNYPLVSLILSGSGPDAVTINSGTFAGMNNLTSVSLNVGKSIILTGSAFEGAPEITFLGFSHVNFSGILPKNAFNGLSKLKSLDLSKQVYYGLGGITGIEDGAFAGLDSLEILTLKKNSIASLSDHSFDGLSSLKTLDISGSTIPSVSPNAFLPLRRLEDLNVYDNNITFMPVFSNKSLLKHLVIGGFISSTHPVYYQAKAGDFDGMDNLEKIELAFHGSVAGLFAPLKSLSEVNFRTDFETVDLAPMFGNHPSLKKVLLDSPLSSYTKALFYKFPNAIEMYVGGCGYWSDLENNGDHILVGAANVEKLTLSNCITNATIIGSSVIRGLSKLKSFELFSPSGPGILDRNFFFPMLAILVN